MPRSNLVTLAFVWKEVKNFNFAQTIAAFDLKIGICIELNESSYMSAKDQDFSLT